MKQINILLFSLLVLVSCQSKGIRNTNNTDVSDTITNDFTLKSGTYWVNYQYLQCMKSKLPCECMEEVEFTILNFNPPFSYIFVYEHGSYYEELQVKRQTDQEYNVYVNLDANIPFFSITIAKDTLYLNKNGIISKYVDYAEFNLMELDKTFIGKLNMKIISELLKSKEFNLINNLNITDSSNLYCNSEIGNVNLLTTSGNCENTWILEIKNDSLVIYKYLNACDPKTYPVKIDKKFTYSLRL